MTVCWQWNSRVISGHFSSSRIRYLHSIPFHTIGNVNKLYFECRSIRYFAKMCKQKFVSMILEREIIRSLFHVESILYGQTFLLVLLRVIGLQCNSIPIYLPGVRARQWAGGDRSPFQWIPITYFIDCPWCSWMTIPYPSWIYVCSVVCVAGAFSRRHSDSYFCVNAVMVRGVQFRPLSTRD